MAGRPYKSTPVFTQDSLPDALRSDHSLKPGCWGRVTLLSGALRYTDVETGDRTDLAAGSHQIIPPERLHFVEPLGAMTMRVDFFDRCPDEGDGDGLAADLLG